MSVAKVIEINAESGESFDDAVRTGIKTAQESVRNIQGAWIKEHKVVIDGGRITAYRVNMKVTFLLD